MSVIRIEKLEKTYGDQGLEVKALRGVSLTIDSGEFVAVMGPSGCGKSTMLHLMGALDAPSSGDVLVNDQSLKTLTDDQLTELRRRDIGFIFQFFNLIPILTAMENVALPLVLDGMNQAKANEIALEWLEKVDIGDRADHLPSQLSGGQQQRVAIARALAADPVVILADEPTGNLDSKAADDIAGLLSEITEKWNKTVVMVTHDPRISAYANRIVHLKDGTIVGDNVMA